MSGCVSLIGAGPGDPELITVKGRRRLREAEVVVHDRLIDPRLVELAPACARRIYVGKTPGEHSWSQSRINALLIAEARRRRKVVRLKGGDPFVFGRGGEECEALARAGIAYEVIPGISSAIAAPALAGIPVTHREHAHAFTVVTGHAAGDPGSPIDWRAVARSDTIVVMMGLARIGSVVAALLEAGRRPDTPAAVISRAGTAEQRSVTGRLDEIEARARGLSSPATIVVGEVTALTGRLAWCESIGGWRCA